MIVNYDSYWYKIDMWINISLELKLIYQKF